MLPPKAVFIWPKQIGAARPRMPLNAVDNPKPNIQAALLFNGVKISSNTTNDRPPKPPLKWF